MQILIIPNYQYSHRVLVEVWMKYFHMKSNFFLRSKRGMANITLKWFRFRMFQRIMLSQIRTIRFSDGFYGIVFLYFDGTCKPQLC